MSTECVLSRYRVRTEYVPSVYRVRTSAYRVRTKCVPSAYRVRTECVHAYLSMMKALGWVETTSSSMGTGEGDWHSATGPSQVLKRGGEWRGWVERVVREVEGG